MLKGRDDLDQDLNEGLGGERDRTWESSCDGRRRPRERQARPRAADTSSLTRGGRTRRTTRCPSSPRDSARAARSNRPAAELTRSGHGCLESPATTGRQAAVPDSAQSLQPSFSPLQQSNVGLARRLNSRRAGGCVGLSGSAASHEPRRSGDQCRLRCCRSRSRRGRRVGCRCSG